jgi:hypothetical protein
MATITFDTIGNVMRDGSAYAGVSPDTGKAMYTTPNDAPLTMTFGQAAEYARDLDAHGHRDWRVPTKAELNVLFQNRGAIRGFDMTGSYPAGWYWSSSRSYSTAWAQRFSNGHRDDGTWGCHLALRCVRG